MRNWLRVILGIFLTNISIALSVAQPDNTPSIDAGLISFDVDEYRADHPATLGLEWAPSARQVTVYAPQAESDFAYNHGAVLTVFQDRFFMQWQSSLRDEDSAETRVMYSVSKDGIDWSEPVVLARARPGVVVTNGGWLHDDQKLVAFLNVWPGKGVEGQSPHGFTEYIMSSDGDRWSRPQSVHDKHGKPIAGIIEQDSRPLPDGRVLTSFHMQPGLKATPYYTSDPLGLSGWTAANFAGLPSDGTVSRELEPSWYVSPEGSVLMLFRDQNKTFQTLVSESEDMGRTWTPPQLSNFPDSRSKQSAGNLPDGTAFRINNPRRDSRRFPLVLSLSKDGRLFDRAFLLRSGLSDMPPMQFDGRYKRHGYSYPKSLVHNGNLYVAYATHKERIDLTIIPIANLAD